MVIRHPEPREYKDIQRLVKSVVNEIYGGLWSALPIEIEDQDWSDAWIASSGVDVVGVILTKDEWIDDLWIRQDHRGKGLGAELLKRGEAEVATLRPTPVTGSKSESEGKFRHETFPIEMLELTKRSDPFSF